VRAAVLVVLMLAAACARTAPTTSARDGTTPERASNEQGPADEAADANPDIDFSDEFAEPSAGVDAQPERPPIGSFDLCGDRCRDNIELEKSLDDEEGGE
jgi:hypothetical protein